LSYYQSRFRLLYTTPLQLELAHQNREGNTQMAILQGFDVVMDGALLYGSDIVVDEHLSISVQIENVQTAHSAHRWV